MICDSRLSNGVDSSRRGGGKTYAIEGTFCNKVLRSHTSAVKVSRFLKKSRREKMLCIVEKHWFTVMQMGETST
jgi:hypothetical protein